MKTFKKCLTKNKSNNYLGFLAFLGILSSITSLVYSQVISPTDEIAPLVTPFEMDQIEKPVFQDKVFSIIDFGAIPFNSINPIKNTVAIKSAIEAATKAGGGIVLIPKGKWLTGPIHLQSNINLHIAEGAEVLFSTDKEDYLPVVRQRHEGVEAYNYSPMIYAFEVSNVAITGKGTLNAQAKHWWEWFEELGPPARRIASKVPLSERAFGKGAGQEGMRPNFIVFWKSTDILVEGIYLVDSPMWNVHFIYSQRIIVRHIDINSLDVPNGDGVVIDSSQDVLIEYNHFQTGDDAVVLKSGLNEEGLLINIPTERVVIRNFEAKNVRTGSGGVVFGSESSGGIKNVYVHDAIFDGSDRGIRFKTERGRGNSIENIFIRDIEMRNITFEAININTFYTGPEATGPSPAIRNISISNVSIDNVPNAIVFTGLPEKWLENISLDRITITNAQKGVRINRVKNLSMSNITVESKEIAMIAEDVYELKLKEVHLKNTNSDKLLLFKGQFTGAIFTTDFPIYQMQFSDNLTAKIVLKEEAKATW